MAITNFIPEVWSAAILEALRAKLVFPSLCNRDYEGDIREAGDTVHITGYDDVTVRKYVRGQAITVDDANDKEAAVLEIDQSDYFAFKVNDLDKAQAKADMTGKFTNSAAYNMMKNVENYISNLMDTAVSTPAKTVAVGTPADAYLAVVEAGRKLDVQNVPDEGRWLVVSPDFYALLLQDSRFIEGTEAGHNTLLNGVVGQVRGFTVVKSNNVPHKSASPDTQSILAGTNDLRTAGQQRRGHAHADRLRRHGARPRSVRCQGHPPRVPDQDHPESLHHHRSFPAGCADPRRERYHRRRRR